MPRVVLDTKRLLDHFSYQPRAPQLGVVPQSLGPALEDAFQLLEVSRIQQRPATCAASFLESRFPRFRHRLRPAIHGLPVDTELPSHFGLAQASLQQTSCFEAPFFESIEIASYTCWISHDRDGSRYASLCQLYYVILSSNDMSSDPKSIGGLINRMSSDPNVILMPYSHLGGRLA